jgi:hypothetical protein
MPETETAEELSKKPEVREELERTGDKKPTKKVKAATTDFVGLAVQTPMKSFIAWIYILVRRSPLRSTSASSSKFCSTR